MGKILKMSGEPRAQVASTASVMEAVQAMAEHRTGAAAIVDGGKLKGLFTERDLMMRVVAKGLDPAKTPVSKVGTFELITVDRKTNPSAALRLMVEKHIRHLPIIDEKGALLGVLSMRKILQARVDELTTQLESLEAYMGADGPGG
jgi:CBS domain-containing protein